MKYIFTIFCVFFVIACAACDDEKKIRGDILVYLSPRDSQSRLYRMTEDEHLTDIHPFDGGWGAFTARWSPDGKRIAFATGKNATTNSPSLYIMDSDGSHAKPIKEIDYGYTKIPLSGYSPAWSPDGKKIAYTFCNCETSSNSEIYVIDLETKEEINLTNNPSRDVAPLWTPDGSKIIFHSDRDYSASYGVEIYTMNVDGSNQTRLTFNRGQGVALSFYDDRISYYSQNDTGFHILDMVTMEDTLIPASIPGEAITATATWSPDNQSILFYTYARDGSARERLYRLSLKDFSIERVLKNYDYVAFVDWLKR